jgi:DnaJ-class molecular chaperone
MGTCANCYGTGSIEYDRGDYCHPAIETCPSCKGEGSVPA